MSNSSGELSVCTATVSDFQRIKDIYSQARVFMSESGNPNQWGDAYPPDSLIMSDIESGCLYTVLLEGRIGAVFYFRIGEDDSYRNIYSGSWLDAGEYAVIHRVAVAERGRGIASFIFDYCFEILPNIRIDTHRDNLPMQRALAQCGFEYCGRILLESGDERLAYQKIERMNN